MSTTEKAFSTNAHSRRGSAMVPPLNEETLASGITNPFGTGSYMLIPGDEGNGFLASASHVTSPGNADSPNALSVLQHQAAAQLEQEYLFTRNNLQQCSRSVLLSVVTSLLDDFPAAMTGEVRLRMERAVTSRGSNAGGMAAPNSPNATSARSQGGVGGRKGSLHGSTSGIGGGTSTLGVNAMPWTPNSHAKPSAGGSVTSPFRNASQSSPTSHRKNGGRNQKNKEEDQELCSVHNNMRAVKHLQRNPTTGLFECIHGFHCLVDGPTLNEMTTAPSPAAISSPRSNAVVSPHHSVVSPLPASHSYSVTNYFDAPAPDQFHLCYARGDNKRNASPGPATADNSLDAPDNGTYFDPTGVNEDDLNQLEDLLETVRNGMQYDD